MSLLESRLTFLFLSVTDKVSIFIIINNAVHEITGRSIKQIRTRRNFSIYTSAPERVFNFFFLFPFRSASEGRGKIGAHRFPVSVESKSDGAPRLFRHVPRTPRADPAWLILSHFRA